VLRASVPVNTRKRPVNELGMIRARTAPRVKK